MTSSPRPGERDGPYGGSDTDQEGQVAALVGCLESAIVRTMQRQPGLGSWKEIADLLKGERQLGASLIDEHGPDIFIKHRLQALPNATLPQTPQSLRPSAPSSILPGSAASDAGGEEGPLAFLNEDRMDVIICLQSRNGPEYEPLSARRIRGRASYINPDTLERRQWGNKLDSRQRLVLDWRPSTVLDRDEKCDRRWWRTKFKVAPNEAYMEDTDVALGEDRDSFEPYEEGDGDGDGNGNGDGGGQVSSANDIVLQVSASLLPRVVDGYLKMKRRRCDPIALSDRTQDGVERAHKKQRPR